MSLYIRCLLLQNVIKYAKIYTNVEQRLQLDKTQINRFASIVKQFHTTSVTRKRRKTAEERKSHHIIEYSPKAKGEIVDVWHNITARELAQVLDKDVRHVYDLFLNKFHDPDMIINDVKALKEAVKRGGKRIRLIAKPNDEVKELQEKDAYRRPPANKEYLRPRPPVVTVMGHVDHGKTTLLDALRHSHVVDEEFGGITQHVGAFSVKLTNGALVTFLDTPGHAAFYSMRERGANVTDLVVLVVAADDGVMEQTIESIRMAKEAKVPLMVAINKIDAPYADVERTKRMLVEVGVQVESLGGDVQAIPVSALKKQNLNQLVEALSLQAELLEIAGDPNGLVEAIVVESRIHPHRGRLSTVVVERGTLKKGDLLVAGTAMCKVRNLLNADGESLDVVKPGYPAEIEGWKDLPSPGDLVLEVENERRAREVLRVRESKKIFVKQLEDSEIIAEKAAQHQHEYKERLALKRRLGRFKLRPTGPRKPEIIDDDSATPKLNLIIKTDVDGTLEAILETLDTYETKSNECDMDLVNYGVGSINETDLDLAKTFDCLIYTFNLNVTDRTRKLAESDGVTIKEHNVIYKLIDDVKSEINKRLRPIEVEEIVGEAIVLKQFDINDGRKKIQIAGCRCTSGTLKRTGIIRLIRDDQVIYEGPLSSMRHLKNEVDVVKNGLECGLQLSDRNVTFLEGDKIVCVSKKLETRTTKWDPGF